MKTTIFFIFSISLFFVSCVSNNGNNHKVTVIKNAGLDNLVGGNKVLVVTESGDTVVSFISESLLLNKAIPFSAVMYKNDVLRYGQIIDTTGYLFEVVVTKKNGYDHIISGYKVTVTTKSGMLVECIIPEKLFLQQEVPFSAIMQKNEVSRYGLITEIVGEEESLPINEISVLTDSTFKVKTEEGKTFIVSLVGEKYYKNQIIVGEYKYSRLSAFFIFLKQINGDVTNIVWVGPHGGTFSEGVSGKVKILK